MGASSAQTVREIEDTRQRIERNLRALEERMPEPAVWGKRIIGIAVGGPIGASIMMFFVRRARKHRKARAFDGSGRTIRATIHFEPD